MKYAWKDMRPGQLLEVAGVNVAGFRSTASSAAKRHGMLLEVNAVGPDGVRCWRVDRGDGVTPITGEARRRMYADAQKVSPGISVRLRRDTVAMLRRNSKALGVSIEEAMRRALAAQWDAAGSGQGD